MTDQLRKALQSIADSTCCGDCMEAKKVAQEALRAALAETPEPVAMRYDGDGDGYLYIDNGSGSDWQRRHKDAEPLYTAPPSIDALIAEIDGVERWFYDDGSGPYLSNTKDGGDYYFIFDIDAILDKYRAKDKP